MREAEKLVPQAGWLYLADQANFPYGEKTAEEVRRLTFKAVEFFRKKGCRLVVLACNTATTNAIIQARQRFPQLSFVGVEPVVKPLAKLTKTGHLAVLSTPATQQSRKLKQLIARHAADKTVYNLACPGLADWVEKGVTDGPQLERLLKKLLAPAIEDRKVDVVGSGCTHYSFIKQAILKTFPKKVKFIEPSRPVAQQVKRLAEKAGVDQNLKKTVFYTTANPQRFAKIASRLLKRRVVAKKVKL